MADQDTNQSIPETKKLDDFQVKFSRLPSDVQDWMLSFEAADNTGKITQKFNLPKSTNPVVAKLTGDAILKEVMIEALPDLLQKNLRIDVPLARQIALEIALKQLLILRNHLRSVEDFILKLGGTLPRVLPSFEPPVAERAFEETRPRPMPTIAKKPFRLAVQENKEILNQLLTASPIKIADFEQPVRQTIKNWLSDYIKQKGAGHHDEMERSDYLYKSANAANLANEERALLAKILRAYDEDTEVPVSPESKLILIEELAKKEAPSVPRAATVPPAPTSPPRPTFQTPSAPVPPARPSGPDSYREAVAEEDLAGPLKPLAKPAPRLDGNIVDLKNTSV